MLLSVYRSPSQEPTANHSALVLKNYTYSIRNSVPSLCYKNSLFLALPPRVWTGLTRSVSSYSFSSCSSPSITSRTNTDIPPSSRHEWKRRILQVQVQVLLHPQLHKLGICQQLPVCQLPREFQSPPGHPTVRLLTRRFPLQAEGRDSIETPPQQQFRDIIVPYYDDNGMRQECLMEFIATDPLGLYWSLRYKAPVQMGPTVTSDTPRPVYPSA